MTFAEKATKDCRDLFSYYGSKSSHSVKAAMEAVSTVLAMYRESVIDRQRQEIERLRMEREDVQMKMSAQMLELRRHVQRLEPENVLGCPP